MTKNIAILDVDNKVINIIVCSDDYILQDNEIEYSENNPAFVGGDYYEGFFYPEQPFLSWTRDNGQWIPPVPKPELEGNWQWSEEDQEWQD